MSLPRSCGRCCWVEWQTNSWLPGRCTGSRLWVHGFYKSKNTGGIYKIVLFKEYYSSVLSSLMTNPDNFEYNITTIFPYFFSFYPVSGPTKHQLKITFFASFFISNSTVREKWINLTYHSSYGKFLEAVNSQNPLCWIRCTSQVARSRRQLLYRIS